MQGSRRDVIEQEAHRILHPFALLQQERRGAVADEAGTLLLEEPVDDGVLDEAADQRLVHATRAGESGKRYRAFVWNVRGEPVVVDETEAEGVRELHTLPPGQIMRFARQ